MVGRPTKGRQNGQGIWLYIAGIRQGSSDFFLLQRRLQDLRSSRLKAFAVEQAIAADPDLALFGRVAASQQTAAPAAAGSLIPCCHPASLSYKNPLKRANFTALLQMTHCYCHSWAPLHAKKASVSEKNVFSHSVLRCSTCSVSQGTKVTLVRVCFEPQLNYICVSVRERLHYPRRVVLKWTKTV